MQLQIIHNDIDTSHVEHMLKFYLGRLEGEVLKLTILFEQFDARDYHYSVQLKALTRDRSNVEFINIHADLLVAMHRVLNRLVRHLHLQQKRSNYLRHTT